MKAISLYHPHAMLVALGEKLWETRGRRTHHRGLIAIHAAKRFDLDVFHCSTQEPFLSVLERHGIATPRDLESRLGGIVALAEIGEVITTREWTRRFCHRDTNVLQEQEYQFGNYEPGRFAWKLENIRRVEPYVPTTGRQWIWTLPPEIETLCLERAHQFEMARCRI